MSCTLSKYKNYEVSEVTQDGDRVIVKLKNPPDSCPEGILNNSHTFIQRDSSVSVPTLSFSTKRNAPVVLMPRGASTTQRVDPIDIPKAESHWFLITLGVLVGAFLLYKLVKWLATSTFDTTSYTGGGVTPTAPDNFNPRPPQGGSGVKSAPTYGYHHTAAPSPQPAPVTVVNSGGGVGDFATGMIVGNMMSGGGHHDTVIEHERIIEHEHIRDPEPTYSDSNNDNSSSDYGSDSDPYVADTSSSDDSYSSSSDDSYSSDSGSSYDSDSGSSYSSDSGSDYGSDSGGGWDSGGSSDGGSFGSDS